MLSLCGCSGAVDASESVTAGYASLSSGSHGEAINEFDAALGAISQNDPLYLDAAIGRIKALCYVDAEKATTEFLAMDIAAGVTTKQCRGIIEDLARAGIEQAATAEKLEDGTVDRNSEEFRSGEAMMDLARRVLAQGLESFPDYEKWPKVAKMIDDRTARLGETNPLGDLKDLGYLGDEKQ